MTHQARQVLDDCRIALQLLEEEKNLQRWRIHWAAAVALIRAVGHVLDKVDGDNPEIKRLSNAAFRKWNSDAPEHEIFRGFIKCERNNVLKEYKFNLHPGEEVEVAVISTLRPVKDGELMQVAGVFPIGENVYRPLMDGFREGDDARDVLSEAIDWWEAELTAIECLLKRK